MKKSRLLGAFCAFFYVSYASAATISFDNYSSTSITGISGSTGTETQGFHIYSELSSHTVLTVGGGLGCSPDCAYNGTVHLHHFHVDLTTAAPAGIIYFEPLSGDDFQLFSFDGAELGAGRTNSNATAMQVTGNYASGGSVSATFNLDGIVDGEGPADDFEKFFLPSTFSGLASVQFEGLGANKWFSLDNIDIDIADELNTVPIPPALWLFGSGLLGLIGVARKKTS